MVAPASAAGPALSQGGAAVHALSQGDAAERAVDATQAWKDPAWLALLAYEPRPGGGWRSESDRDDFFVAADGRNDPRAEILAEIAAMASAANAGDADLSTACRFPARREWLQRRLALLPAFDVLASCPALSAWYSRTGAPKASLGFASACLENPSSMFGHTFLRFDREGTPVLMDATSNHEADTSRHPNPFSVVARGLFGGFRSVAAQLPFHRRLRTYGDIEGRDVWDYPLALDPARVRLLLLALWEQKDGAFGYGFLRANCSWRLVTLLDAAAADSRLRERFPLEVAPIDTVKVLRREGLAGEPEFWPSPVRTFRWHVRSLSAKQASTVRQLARGEQRPDTLAGLQPNDKAQLLRAAAEYSSILVHRGELAPEVRERVTHDLVQARLAAASPLPVDPPPTPEPPEQGHATSMLSAGWSNRSGLDALELAVAGFHHDRLDRLAGYERGAQVVVLGGRLRMTEGGGAGLESLDLLRVSSNPPGDRYFPQSAFRILLGAERKSVDQGRPLLATASWSGGRSFDLGAGILALEFGACVDSGSSLRGDVALEGTASARLSRQAARYSVEAFVEHGRYVAGDRSHRLQYGMAVGIPFARDLGLVLRVERGGADSTETIVATEWRLFF